MTHHVILTQDAFAAPTADLISTMYTYFSLSSFLGDAKAKLLIENNDGRPKCVMCLQVLANEVMK